MGVSDEGLNPTQEQTIHSNPSPPNQLEADDSQGVVQGMQGLAPTFNFEKEKDSFNRKKNQFQPVKPSTAATTL